MPYQLSFMRFCLFALAAVLLLTASTAPLGAQQPTALSITTNPLLPSGTVGSPYSVTLEASGGTPPLTWQVVSGVLPEGLSLNAQTGVIAGAPTSPGTFPFQIQVDDSADQNARRNFTITVDAQGLTIVSDSILPRARVGVEYTTQITASGGNPPYRNWRVTSGILPQGLALSAGTGQISGTPTSFGTFSFTIAVSDSAFQNASKRFTLVVDPASLTITTQSPLSLATVGNAYQQAITASGGPTPLVWEVVGSLPDGLALNAASGTISGTPSAVGLYSFDIRVTDAGDAMATRTFELTVADPTATISIGGESGPAQQPQVMLMMSVAHPFPIAGQLSVSFQPDAANNSDDDTIGFSPSGNRTVQFTVPANTQQASFAGGDLALQTGTTAGVATLSVTALQTGSQAIPLTSGSDLEVAIPRLSPRISSAEIRDRTGTGFTVRITGYSTVREVTGAVFRFTPVSGQTLQNSQVSVALNDAANSYYQTPESSATGGAFVYTQPFTIQGSISAIQSMSITLTNSVGESEATTLTF